MTDHSEPLFLNPNNISDRLSDELVSLYFDKSNTFQSLGLDRRLARAVARMNYVHPSLVQSKTIPFVLSGRDLLVRARTGTGKTSAYTLPILQKLLPSIDQANIQLAPSQSTKTSTAQSTTTSTLASNVLAIILVPSRELVGQVVQSIRDAGVYLPSLRVAGLSATPDSPQFELAQERQLLSLSPHIIVGTPTRVLEFCQQSIIALSQLQFAVFDEADLLLSHGYDEDIRDLTHFFPPHVQTLLMSATLSPELDALRNVVTHNPAIIKLNDDHAARTLHQFQCPVLAHEKFLIFYTHFVQGMYKKKTLFFVNTIETAFKLQIFLHEFGIHAVVLNDDLPFNSRKNIILQFNQGIFQYLIATDVSNNEIDLERQDTVDQLVEMIVDGENELKQEVKLEHQIDQDDDDNDDGESLFDVTVLEEDEDDDDNDISIKPERIQSDDEDDIDDEDQEEDIDDDEDDDEEEEEDEKQDIKQVRIKEEPDIKMATGDVKSSQNKDSKVTTSSISRGLDFQNVAVVVNFDLPSNLRSYVHRIGRTARGGKVGVAVTYIVYNNAYQRKVELTGSAVDAADEMTRFEQMNLELSIVEGDELISAKEQRILPLAIDETLKQHLNVRVSDVVSKIGRRTIKEARLNAVKQELIHSERLQRHWELHPDEMVLLQHNSVMLHGKKISSQTQRMLEKRRIKENKSLPSYLQTATAITTQGVNPQAVLKEAAQKRKSDKAKFFAAKAKKALTEGATADKKETDPLRKKQNKDKKENKGGKRKQPSSGRDKAGGAAKKRRR